MSRAFLFLSCGSFASSNTTSYFTVHIGYVLSPTQSLQCPACQGGRTSLLSSKMHPAKFFPNLLRRLVTARAHCVACSGRRRQAQAVVASRRRAQGGAGRAASHVFLVRLVENVASGALPASLCPVMRRRHGQGRVASF